jgi:glycosyltransferase involved in cell wall biosynthesis
MDNKLVSIIIPVYNAERYLAEAIQSAINQTWDNTEIIVVDDGSRDRSLQIAKSFTSTKVIVIGRANAGASAARNAGLKSAKGSFIQFLDADDLLAPDKISQQMAVLNNREDCVAFGGTIHFMDGTNPYELKHDVIEDEGIDPVYFLQRLYGGVLIEGGKEGMIQPNAWLTPRALIEKAGYWNEQLTVDDDGEFFCRVILASKKILYTTKAINYYRKFTNRTSLSGQKNYEAYKSALDANELKFTHLKNASADKQTNIALAKLYTEYMVGVYPRYPDLYNIAKKRLQQLPKINYVPAIGGQKTELIKKIFGWKVAKTLIYYVNK